MSKLTTKEFAEKVNLTYGRIVQLIQDDELPAEKFGHVYMIDEKFVALIKNRPEKRGRKKLNRSREEIAA